MSNEGHDRFSAFFVETRQALQRYLRRLVDSRDAAEDIAQEAYARTYAQGDSVKAPKAFLFTTARNLVWNAHRHERIAATDTVGNIDDYGYVNAGGPTPEAGLIADEEARLLKQAVEHLPPQCRAAFTLKVFHAYSYKEIAEKLGVSTKTVEKHISRGLHDTHAFMRRRYQMKDEDEGPIHE